MYLNTVLTEFNKTATVMGIKAKMQNNNVHI